MTTETTISAALILDTSYSMTASKYVDITQIDSKAFISCLRQGDKIAICNYDTNGHTPYTLHEVTDTNNVLAEATNVIQNLSFQGNSTNIAAGLTQGLAQINNQNNSKALVLLSDGFNNAGPGPLSVPPPNYPIFSCAMGPYSDQDLMQQIAARTPYGQYYYAPKVVDMMRIYNQIRAINPQTQGIANELKSIDPQNYQLVPATIAKGNSEAQFVVVWTDPSLSYTSGNPTSNQLSITLVDPNMHTINDKPTYIGDGYVIFDLHNPLVGKWMAQILHGSDKNSLPVTVGAFEFQNDPSQQITLHVDAPDTSEKGQPISFSASVTHGNEPIDNISVSAEITRPKMSLEKVLEHYKADMSSLSTSDTKHTDLPDEIGQLVALHQKKLPETDILSHITSIQHLTSKNEKSARLGTFEHTHESGSYNLHVKVKGVSHINGTSFERNKLISVLVK